MMDDLNKISHLYDTNHLFLSALDVCSNWFG